MEQMGTQPLLGGHSMRLPQPQRGILARNVRSIHRFHSVRPKQNTNEQVDWLGFFTPEGKEIQPLGSVIFLSHSLCWHLVRASVTRIR